MLTFTVPPELRPLIWAHQRILYGLMNRCSWQTVQSFCRNDKQLKGSGGAITVLHTHSRRLDYHPHVHLVMPAAAIDTASGIWRTKKARKGGGKEYLFNHKALAKDFRAKMLKAIAQEGLVLPANTSKKWVIDCMCVGTGEKALVYLYRGVIQEKDILACEDGRVSFRYQNSKRKRTERRTVDGATFLWLVLQHILPKGFRRTRNFGFLHTNSKRLIGLLQYLFGMNRHRTQALVKKRPSLICQCCGATMGIVRTRIPPLWPICRPVPVG